jgi:hypothetical protein
MGALLWTFRPAVMPAVGPLTIHSDRKPQINGDLRWQEDLHRIVPSSGTSVPCKALCLSARNSVRLRLKSSLVCLHASVSC